MKKLFLIPLFLFVFSSFLLSESFTHLHDIKIGKQPVVVKYDKNHYRIHVFCLGYDANFNGVFDYGDEKPSWWFVPQPGIVIPSISVTDSIVKVMDFEMGSLKFPLRPYFNLGAFMDDGFVVLSINDTLKKFSLRTGEINNGNLGVYKSNDILFENNLVFLANSNNSKGEIIILNGYSFLPLDTIPLDKTPNGVLRFTKDTSEYLAVIFEGSFGKSDSKMEIFQKHDLKWDSIKTLSLGATANHFTRDSNNIYVAMNGSHEIQVVDLITLEIIKSLPTVTTLYDGPREVKVLNGGLFVSTYAGDIRRYNISNWQLTSIIEANAKVEGFDFIEDKYLISACPFKKDSYESDSILAVFGSVSSIDNYENINDLKLSYFSNILKIESNNEILKMELYNSLGENIFSQSLHNSFEFSKDFNNLTNGIYLIQIITTNAVISKKILHLN